MNVYIAAKFQNQEEAKKLAALLHTKGHEVKARWIWQKPLYGDPDSKVLHDLATRDLEDIRSTDAFIIIPDAIPVEGAHATHDGPDSGGRHVEMGYALAHHKPVFVLGVKNNIFHWLHELVTVCDTVEVLLEELRKRR